MPELRDHPYVFSPAEDPDAPTLLLLLHGTGADEHDLLALGDHLREGGAILSPRGRVREQGMNRWFRRLAEGVFDIEDVIRRAGDLAGFVQAAVAEHGLDPENVLAAGFSNGANTAAAVMLLHPGVLRGGLLFSSMLPVRPQTAPDLSGTEVFMSAGRVDAMAPADHAQALATLLEECGAVVRLHWHDLGHGIDMAQLEAALGWLRELRATSASGEGASS
jgi:phospholipase/carboxylesterase